MWISVIFYLHVAGVILSSSITDTTSKPKRHSVDRNRYNNNSNSTRYSKYERVGGRSVSGSTQVPSYNQGQVTSSIPFPAYSYVNTTALYGNIPFVPVQHHQPQPQYYFVNGYYLYTHQYQPQPQQQPPQINDISQITPQLLITLIHYALASQPAPYYSSIYDPRSFLFKLSEIPASRDLPASTHLDCLVNFLVNNYSRNSEDAVLYYFSYILDFHLSHEAKFANFKNVILPHLYKLISTRCRLPEIIGPLLRLISRTLTLQDRHNLHTQLEVSIYENAKLLDTPGFNRFVEIIELFCEFVQVPPHYNDHMEDSEGVSVLWIVYKFTPIFSNLLGFYSDPTNMISNFVAEHFQSDTPVTRNNILTLKYYSALNVILKRVLYRANSTEKQNQLNSVLPNTLSGLGPETVYFAASYRLTHLLDVLLSYKRVGTETSLDFNKFVHAAFNIEDASRSLRCVCMFIAYNPISLLDYRRESILLEFEGVNQYFLKALEVIVAAVDGIEPFPHFYLTWEPSLELLYTLREILNFESETVSIFDTSYLSEAAAIFLVRQTGFNYSRFCTYLELESISWNDMLCLVRYHFSIIHPEMAQRVEVKSVLSESFPADIELMIQFIIKTGEDWKGTRSIYLASDSASPLENKD